MSRRRAANELVVAGSAIALSVIAAVMVASAAPHDEAWLAIRTVLVVCVPVAGGLYALRSPDTARFGFALTSAGFLWSLTALASSSHSVPYSVGRVVGWLIFPSLLYLVIVYPDGRLRRGVARDLYLAGVALVCALYVGSALAVEAYPTETPWAQCDTDCPANAFFVLGHEPAWMQGFLIPLRETLTAALMVAYVVWLLLRLHAATPQRRRHLTPVAAAAIGWCLTLAAFMVARLSHAEPGVQNAIGSIFALWVPVISAAFLAGLVTRRVMVAQALERLSVALTHDIAPCALRGALARALGDPAVDLLLPDDAPGRWRSVDGSAASPSAASRHATTITDGPRQVAVLVHDPELLVDESLLDAVRSLILTALQHDQMRRRLAASLHELEDSRNRLVRAADQERSRIERDLHDGAQQRLVMLRIKLSLAAELLESDPATGREAVAELGEEVERALKEVREIARGVYPAILSDRGLEDALRGGVADSLLPVHLITHGVERQPPEIELAIYYVCLEALQNATKHARGASAIWITLRQDDDQLTCEVRDDGPGFVAVRAPGGLRNMADRIEAVGGSLVIESALGRGTRIVASVPLTRMPAAAT
ncbi:MAG TPA: sensor histidine kinase [Solirubrobacter sp.]|nr:sensor histidine kinase [Solirubrobacter sp.]